MLPEGELLVFPLLKGIDSGVRPRGKGKKEGGRPDASLSWLPCLARGVIEVIGMQLLYRCILGKVAGYCAWTVVSDRWKGGVAMADWKVDPWRCRCRSVMWREGCRPDEVTGWMGGVWLCEEKSIRAAKAENRAVWPTYLK